MNKLTKKKLLFISLVLLLINLLVTILLWNLDNSTYENLDGTEVEAHSSELIRGVVVGQLISIPILSLLIGLVVAIFIDKDAPYPRRIIRSSLLALTTIYGIFTVMGVIKVITFL